MQRLYDAKYKDYALDINLGLLCKWFAILLKIGQYGLKNREMYWQKQGEWGADYQFSKIMSKQKWDRI